MAIPTVNELRRAESYHSRLAREIRRELLRRREGYAPREFTEIAEASGKRVIGAWEQELLISLASVGRQK